MEKSRFSGPGWEPQKYIRVIEQGDKKTVLLNDRFYMSWQLEDEASQRMAIAQVYESGLVTQEDIAEAFRVNIKSVYNYIQAFRAEGSCGIISQKRGPRVRPKINPRLRSKILLIALKEGILESQGIQNRLEQWNERVSISSIRQVLLENGLIDEITPFFDERQKQPNLFNRQIEKQMFLNLTHREKKEKETEGESVKEQIKETLSTPSNEIKPRRYYSPAQRTYLDQLEQGDYNAYAGGLLFAPLLQHYSFLPTIKRIIDLPTYEGYSLEELCLTLFYSDLFNFHSIEDFKRAYPEEFGNLLGLKHSPSLFTLRRFLHKVKEQEKSEELIDEFACLYLKKGLAAYGALYIDAHFLPYYGIYPITMGWHGVRKVPMKGSYNFLATDGRFNPWLFLIRSSSEDLLQKIPELIEKAKQTGKRAGISKEYLQIPVVIFDREGYSAELYRHLEGKDSDQTRKAIFISWAKYTEKWVYKIPQEEFISTITVGYKIRDPKKIRYLATERTMSKYGKVRAIVVERLTDKKRCAIYTNAKEAEMEDETIIEMMCRRWGEENLIKELLSKHLINYSPGHETEDLQEQPLIDNPKRKELKQKRAKLKQKLSQIKSSFGHQVLEEMAKDADWAEVKKKRLPTIADIEIIHSQITLLNHQIDELPEKISFDEAHGKRLVELNYEKKRFLDCIKIFTYNMKNRMCQMLLKHYDKKKEVLPALAMITERAGHIRLEDGKLKVRLRRFKNTEIDYAARRLCEDLNRMKPTTLDKFQFPIHYEVL